MGYYVITNYILHKCWYCFCSVALTYIKFIAQKTQLHIFFFINILQFYILCELSNTETVILILLFYYQEYFEVGYEWQSEEVNGPQRLQNVCEEGRA